VFEKYVDKKKIITANDFDIVTDDWPTRVCFFVCDLIADYANVTSLRHRCRHHQQQQKQQKQCDTLRHRQLLIESISADSIRDNLRYSQSVQV